MDRAEIETRVKKVLAEQLAVDEQQVVPDARFAEDLNADSLDLVEAVLALEEEWSIEIPEDEMESVKTVGAGRGPRRDASWGCRRAVMATDHERGGQDREHAGRSSSPGSARSRRSARGSRSSGPASPPVGTASARSPGSRPTTCR